MSVPAKGFCVLVQRKRQEKRSSKSFARTVSSYQCFWNGAAIPSLEGQLVERGGPGNNTTAIGNVKDLRIEAGTYPLAVHDGTKFQTFGYSNSLHHNAMPRPGILLLETGERSAILVHPGLDYVWSVGCLNPASGLVNADSAVSYPESRAQVIAIINEMQAKLGVKFPKKGGTRIPGAVIVIEGEP
jgi:hypothetical protein